MSMEPDHLGRCLCGAVKLEVMGEPKWVGHCHCPSCQKATSAAFATYAGFNKSSVLITGEELTVFRSSPGVTRRFCNKCGSAVSFEGEAWPDEIHLHMMLLDDAKQFEPGGHVYVKNQQPWLHLKDGLPMHKTFSEDDS